MESETKSKAPIVNCHTHVFTGDHVPPFLAKTFLPWPLYYLFPMTALVGFLRWYDQTFGKWKYQYWFKRFVQIRYKVKMFFKRYFLFHLVSLLVGLLLTLQVFFFLYELILMIAGSTSASAANAIEKSEVFFERNYLLFPAPGVWLNVLFTILLMLFFPSGRNLILFIFKGIFSFLKALPGKDSTALIKRYLLIGQVSKLKYQHNIFSTLATQYPEGSKFIVLPMDMEYMGAGNVPVSYYTQMADLARIKSSKIFKDIILPFVFVDPRRIQCDPQYFDMKVHGPDSFTVDHKCFVKKYIEGHQFSGFKIYPALGYYPFEAPLLKLWKYAVDNDIPITTHCIRGTIFYRGSKIKEWDTHPIFEQVYESNRYESLLLPETKNKDFCNNFTHPLNYLVLLEEKLLRKLVGKSDADIKLLYGYTNDSTPLLHNLSKLKICFAHFGGDDEWTKYLEAEKNDHSTQLRKRPNRGIEFLTHPNGSPSPGKLEQIWKTVDWYSIICSMILQYENVYADISYILQNQSITPLLKQTLHSEGLQKKVLYGTDYYVVRNHKSDQQMLHELMAGLSSFEFDMIARENPGKFLSNSCFL